MLPDFAVIGAQKSASSFLHECLAEHPDVFIPHEETAFFEDHLYRADDLGWLEKRFDNEAAHNALRRGIKRPNYLAIPQCASRISKHLSKAQFVIVLRHPVSRLVSAWFHYMKSGRVPFVTLNEGISALLEGRLTRSYPRAHELLDFGFYDKHLANYFSFFPRDSFLIFLHEDVIRDPLETIQTAYRFLSVDEGFHPKNSLAGKPKAAVYNLKRLKLRSWLHDRAFVQTNEVGTRSRKQTFAEAPIASSVYTAGMVIDEIILKRLLPNSKPSLDPSIQERLQEIYRASILRLNEDYGLDVTSWIR